MFLLLVFLIGITYFIQKYIFAYAGENLTFDVRNLLYRGILYKNVAWFDRKDRAPGILSNILSEDIGVLNGMTTEHLAILIEAYGGVVIGAIISIFFTWMSVSLGCGILVFISLIAYFIQTDNSLDHREICQYKFYTYFNGFC